MEKTAIVLLQLAQKQFSVDLEVPLDISAERVIRAIRATYALAPAQEPYIVCENPIALISGRKTLGEFGVRNGSVLRCMD